MNRTARVGRTSAWSACSAVLVASVVLWSMANATAQGPGARLGSVFHPDSSYNAESLLRNAARQVQDQQWAEAIDLYLRVVEQFGDTVAQVPKGNLAPGEAETSQLYVNARRYCQEALANLPAEGLALYRTRVDARAAQLFSEAGRTRDCALLRRIIDEMFASSWTDQALDLLGDLEFRAGRFREALAAYQMVVSADTRPHRGLVYPDPDVDRSQLAAKILLCRAAQGNAVTAAELTAYRQANPEAQGSFAGRSGWLGETLSEAIAQDRWLARPSMALGWPTFAGAPNRNGIAAEKVDVGSFQWKIDLLVASNRVGPDIEDVRGFVIPNRPRVPEEIEPATFPIILGETVVICNETLVEAFHLDARPSGSGDAEVRKDVRFWASPYPQLNAPPTTRGASGSPRFTLSASGDRIFARLGPAQRNGGGGELRAIRSNREVEGKILWRKPASEITLPIERAAGEHAVACYEGAPVADETRVYIALTDASSETWAYVACLDAESGAVVWVRYLGNASPIFDTTRNQALGSAVGNRLLSLAGSRIYYQMNMGAVACLDAESGAVRWVATYPRQERLGDSKRSLSPAIVADGLVIVAPEDSQSLFAFDEETGRLAWKSQPVPQIVHVLGTAGCKLFATGDRLYTIDVKSGRFLRHWPEAGAGGIEGFGRGLLAGDAIYWPTRTEIHVLDQATGGDSHATIPLFQSFGYGGGNLAAGNGYLVVAQKDKLIVFCQNRRLIEQYRMRIAQSPEPAMAHYQLSRLAEASGEYDLALSSLSDAAKLARASDLVDGIPLADAAQARRHQLLVRLADEALRQRDWPRAIDLLGEAATIARSNRERLTSFLRLAEARQAAGQPAEAVAALQDILADQGLIDLTIPADELRSLRADLWVNERLQGLIAAHGRAIYARFDARAQQLLERGRREADPRLLREVWRSYPASEAAPEALLSLARFCESNARLAEAVSAYKRLALLTRDDDHRASALCGLAACYEAQGFLTLARETYERAKTRFGSIELRSFGEESTVAVWASKRLAALTPRSALVESTAIANGAWFRSKAYRWDSDVKPLVVRGSGAEGSRAALVLAEGSRARSFELGDGQSAWQIDTGSDPVWAASHGNLILIGSHTQVVAVARESGQLAWRFDRSSLGNSSRLADPFARPELPQPVIDAQSDIEPVGRFHGFRLVAGRLFLLFGDRAMLAVDPDDGRLVWSYRIIEPRSGAPRRRGITPYWAATDRQVILQVGTTNSIIVLDADTGARGGESAGREEDPPWAQAPLVLDDERIAMAADPRTVSVFDIGRGVDVWTYHDDSALPRAVPPLLLNDEGVLLALFGGQQLIRLNPATGQRLWTRGIGLIDLTDAADSIAIDQDRVYLAWGASLTAYQLSDGGVAWSRHVPGLDAASSVALLGPCVAVFPSPDRLAGKPVSTVPLLFCRRDSGAPVQRLLFASPASALSVVLDESTVIVAIQSAAWTLSKQKPSP